MEERISLRDLKTRDDIVILKSDQGNNTAIMDKPKYIQNANSLLNMQTYSKIKCDPTIKLEKKAKELLEQSDIPEQIIKEITPKNSIPPRLYRLPKVHKPDIPLRPIVSNIESLTYGLAKYLADKLKKKFCTPSSHVQNT